MLLLQRLHFLLELLALLAHLLSWLLRDQVLDYLVSLSANLHQDFKLFFRLDKLGLLAERLMKEVVFLFQLQQLCKSFISLNLNSFLVVLLLHLQLQDFASLVVNLMLNNLLLHLVHLNLIRQLLQFLQVVIGRLLELGNILSHLAEVVLLAQFQDPLKFLVSLFKLFLLLLLYSLKSCNHSLQVLIQILGILLHDALVDFFLRHFESVHAVFKLADSV